MANTDGPWKRNPPPPPNSGVRFAIWIALLILGAIALLALARTFPGSVSGDWDSAYLIRMIAILVLVSGGVVLSGRFKFREAIRHAAIWLGIFAVLAIGYTFQDDLQGVALRVRSALIPGYAVTVNASEWVLSESEGGSFYVFGTVNGTPIRFLIDTGASDIVLSQSDAKLIGNRDREPRLFPHLWHGKRDRPWRGGNSVEPDSGAGCVPRRAGFDQSGADGQLAPRNGFSQAAEIIRDPQSSALSALALAAR